MLHVLTTSLDPMTMDDVAARARTLLDELNDFVTASAALQWLFESTDALRLPVLLQILRWQNTDATKETLETVTTAFSDTASATERQVTSDMVLLVMGKPALLFATSIYDEDLALLVWRGLVAIQQQHPGFNLLRQAMENDRDGHGLSALHYAIEAQMPEFVVEVCGWLAEQDVDALQRAIQSVRTQDVVLPVSKTQMSAKSIASGGCTLLHLAAKKGETEIVKVLMDAPIGLREEDVGVDWDGLTVSELAALHKRLEITKLLFSTSSRIKEIDIDALQARRDETATKRYAQSMIADEAFTTPAIFRSIWSTQECTQVLVSLEEATATRGWSKQRHTSYPTTDLPCYHAPVVDSWVRSCVRDRLFSQVYQHFAIPSNQVLTFRELFFVKYEARGDEQAALPLHCDGSVLSFNILLNPSDEFQGGGTYFEESDSTIHIEQGDAVVHSGKVRHAGATVTQGRRLILVGFLGLVERIEW